MEIGRRRLIALLGSSPLLALSGRLRAARRVASHRPRLYLSANALADGSFRIAAVTSEGRRAYELPLPGRGHGFAIEPGGRTAVAVARRPGTFAIAFDLRDGGVHALLSAPAGRHFHGHGAYSADGRILFTTENDFAAGRGAIGVWDAADGYRRVGEYPSHGIGPHEILLAPDGRTLIVANGGILTHPDTGRRKLNIPTMNPSLAYIDGGDGRLLARYGFARPRHRLLSIRHIAANADGVACIALQDQGPPDEAIPLVAFHRAGDDGLDLHAAPPAVTRRLDGYMGSVAMDAEGAIAAVSAPRGDRITFWHVARRGFLGAVRVTDGCGVAADGMPGRFLATSGAGGAARLDGAVAESVRLETPFLVDRRWDNHLVAWAGGAAAEPQIGPGRGEIPGPGRYR